MCTSKQFGRKTRETMRRRAFTLVELLVVVGIISILIAVLMPSLQKARQAAQTVQCLTQMRQVGMAALMYVNDNKGWLLAKCDSAPGVNDGKIVVKSGYGCEYLDDLFYLMNKNIKIFDCPANFVARSFTTAGAYAQVEYPYGPRPYMPSFAVNGAVMTLYLNPAINGAPWGPVMGLKYKQFRNPSSKVWYGESGLACNNYVDPYPHTGTYNGTVEPVESWGCRLGINWAACYLSGSPTKMLSGRHGKFKAERGNVVFVDGHAETVNVREMWADVGYSFHLWYESGPKYKQYWDPDGDGYIGTPKPW